MSLVQRLRRRRSRRFALLDRDGVLNVDTGYAHQAAELQLMPGAAWLCHHLRRRGYTLVVVTNQSGLARGLFDETAYLAFTEALQRALGLRLDIILPCPHWSGGRVAELSRWCACRKPRPGLITRALRQHGGDRSSAFLIGDSLRDIQAARRAGIANSFLLRPGRNQQRVNLPRGVRRLRRLADLPR